MQVRAAISSIVGSLRGGRYGPDSGLNWAAAYLTVGNDSSVVVATTDAGWLPPGVAIPTAVRVLWNVPATAWATIDDPVRQIVAYAADESATIHAVASTHASRVHHVPNGPWKLITDRAPGHVLSRSVPRLDTIASAERVAHIRALSPEDAARQCRALMRDVDQLPLGRRPLGDRETRSEVLRYLSAGREVTASALERLGHDDDAVTDAIREPRTSPRVLSSDSPAPDGAALRRLLLERAVIGTAIAAAEHDVESAVYCWTFARNLARMSA